MKNFHIAVYFQIKTPDKIGSPKMRETVYQVTYNKVLSSVAP